ncbi:hypothetical protein ACPOL_6462 [Acidisarcina polymorpha]|uniref:Uncharacterized protein n=1 Tax=Acidisarcina polymorpha TaxID=2211140 RepID=A0A2Z5G9L7_9BACT|nr:hypothetical protein ACPOL_6462 [Acidisarcina polymorpha]
MRPAPSCEVEDPQQAAKQQMRNVPNRTFFDMLVVDHIAPWLRSKGKDVE